jgi:hypothetical protein
MGNPSEQVLHTGSLTERLQGLSLVIELATRGSVEL